MQNINKVTDTMTRSLIWSNISQMNKQGLMKLDDYVTFLAAKLLA